jgi:hypothetical protein
MRETGLTPMYFLRQMPMVIENGRIKDFDLSIFESQLDRMIEEDVIQSGKMVIETYSYFTWHLILKQINPAFKTSDKNLWDQMSSAAFVDAYGLLIQRVAEIARARGVEVIFSLLDEPGVDHYRRIVADRLATIIHGVGGKTSATYYMSCETPVENVTDFTVPDNTIPSLADKVDYKNWAMRDEGPGFDVQDEDFGYYTTYYAQLRDPVYNRFLHGLMAYATGADVITVYSIGDSMNDPFNDFDPLPDGIYPANPTDYNLVYATWDDGRIMPTMAVEGLREGITDLRYIATLERLIAEYPNSAAAQQAAAYLAALKGRIQTDIARDYMEQGDGFGFAGPILEDVSENGAAEFASFTRMRETVSEFIKRILAGS